MYTKTQLLFPSKREVWINMMCHPVLYSILYRSSPGLRKSGRQITQPRVRLSDQNCICLFGHCNQKRRLLKVQPSAKWVFWERLLRRHLARSISVTPSYTGRPQQSKKSDEATTIKCGVNIWPLRTWDPWDNYFLLETSISTNIQGEHSGCAKPPGVCFTK